MASSSRRATLVVANIAAANRDPSVYDQPDCLDITRDGKQFVGVIAGGTVPSATAAASQLQVVLNWFEELNARVPIK